MVLLQFFYPPFNRSLYLSILFLYLCRNVALNLLLVICFSISFNARHSSCKIHFSESNESFVSCLLPSHHLLSFVFKPLWFFVVVGVWWMIEKSFRVSRPSLDHLTFSKIVSQLIIFLFADPLELPNERSMTTTAKLARSRTLKNKSLYTNRGL